MSNLNPALTEAPMRPRRLSRLFLRTETGGAVSALLVFGFFAIAASDKGFLTLLGTASWLDTASDLGIIALGLGMLTISGEFDISIGSVVGMTSMIVAIFTGYYGLSPWVGIAVALVMGTLVGVLNGIIVVTTRLPSFIVTLAMMLVVTGGMLGLSIALTGSTNLSATASGSAAWIFASNWEEFHISIVHWILLAGLVTFVMARTSFGNWVYATGGNAHAALLAGVPVARVKIILFAVTSLAGVLTGINETLTFQNGNITLGSQYVFTGIAAVVIGGVVQTGGYGSPLGTVFGSLTYGIVSLGVFYLGWNADLIQLFIGVLLLMAVLVNNRLRQLALGRS